MIPRDLFNESNFLKCLGQLSLLVHDSGGLIHNVPYSIDYDGDAFDVQQDESGNLYCRNFIFYCDNVMVDLHRPINSREDWPLYGTHQDEEYCIFNGKGEFMPNFGHPDYKHEGASR